MPQKCQKNVRGFGVDIWPPSGSGAKCPEVFSGAVDARPKCPDGFLGQTTPAPECLNRVWESKRQTQRGAAAEGRPSMLSGICVCEILRGGGVWSVEWGGGGWGVGGWGGSGGAGEADISVSFRA